MLQERSMCGTREEQRAIFSYVTLERRIPQGHPLRRIRFLVDRALGGWTGNSMRCTRRPVRPPMPRPARELLAGLGPLPARCI